MTTPHAAVASIRFRAGIGGEPIIQQVRPSGAYRFEPAKWGATIVGSPSSPVAGDRLALKVTVGVGCCAEVRSSRPTVARRGEATEDSGATVPAANGSSGPATPTSSVHVTATVASDAMLTWRPEAGVAADSCWHRNEAGVDLAGSARLLWRDEFLTEDLTGPPTGTWSSRLRVVRDGWPVVCTELAVGPAAPLWTSRAVLDGARAVSSLVVIDPEPAVEAWHTCRATDGSATGVALPLAGSGIQIFAWGDDLPRCRDVVERLVANSGVPQWAAARWRRRALDVVG